MENINQIIGKNLMKLRKAKKLTQLELAEKFNYTDKSISKWENGESLPNVEVLYSLAKFYNVTLDDLASEEEIVLNSAPKHKTGKEKLLPARLAITLVVICAIWVAATAFYVSFKITKNLNLYTFFVWAVPISCIMLVIFNSVWGKPKYLFSILTVLVWSTLASFYFQFLAQNLWALFILGVPLQLVVIASAGFVAPKKKKPLKTLTENETTEAETSPLQANTQLEEENKPTSDGKIEITLPQIKNK